MIGMLFDVTVLGSGLSGLIAGSLLVKRGFNVLMAEIDEQSQAIEKQGYRLRRFPGAFFGFGKGQIFSEVFTELGIPFLDKKRFSIAEPAYQFVSPARRVDIPQDREQLFKTLNYEFPKESGRMMALINEVDRYAQVFRNFFGNDIIYPPSGFGEGWAVRKAFGGESDLLKDAMKIRCKDFMDGYELSAEPRAFINSQVQFLSPIFPADPNLAFASNFMGLNNGGIFLLDGGVKVLESIFKERISSYRGAVHRSPSIESVEFGKFIEIRFSDQKEPVKTRHILLADNPQDFFQKHLPKLLKSDFKEKMEVPPPPTHDFVTYFGIDAEVVPVGMEPNVIVIKDPEAPLIDDNLVMISLSAPGDEGVAPAGKRLLAARVKVSPETDRLDSATAEKISMKIADGLRELMPFFDDFTDFIAVKESFELYMAERHDAWMQSIDDDRLGVALLPYRTPHKSVYYAGRAVLPGLGMEGEAIAARTAANILSEKLAKK